MTDPSPLPGADHARHAEPTIEDVAAAAGVSIRTVSRVLNKSPKVNAQTRERIEAAIAALHFRPSLRARALAMRRSFLIGLIHNDRNALVLDSIQRGIVSVTAEQGYELIVHSTPLAGDAAIADVIGFAGRSRVDGLIVLPPISGVAGLAGALDGAQVPAVAVSSVPLDGFAGVILSDERGAGAQVARHLLDLGHRRLGLVNGPTTMASARERRAGFIGEAAGTADASVAETAGDYGFASGMAAAQALLAGPDRPTAIFAANDIMAAGVLKVAARMGLGVPDQLSVVGFDGSMLAQMLTPALTSVLRPFDAIAAAATRHLIARIEGTALPAPFHPTLAIVPAETTGPAPKS
ncbi:MULTISPECIES: LacI family DNA-binding transcriptional regulator [unclassified Novosphingobium]|uniref:LacI family DNA-binding transcriptional regulator n=1 Tax=unclassified Novosphingobium TaxID=2644732 RepID=UPI00146A0FB1|nr:MULTISPECIES: LacI family DNA-binding transcriptional regulator [unclassified Novosphingobium]NMN05282.1 LacI family transcriptional regulator [Novosphingobium sp. SG919]NMN87577.1 LacI family transcriptional regulator [Novosphingobium sp. SG916]